MLRAINAKKKFIFEEVSLIYYTDRKTDRQKGSQKERQTKEIQKEEQTYGQTEGLMDKKQKDRHQGNYTEEVQISAKS